jgi:hypothetical protein
MIKPRTCPFCGAEMLFHHSRVHHTLWSQNDYVGIYARDEQWKCPNCFYVARFGFPITKEEYLRQWHEWGSQYDVEAKQMDKQKLMKRLRQLGYLDVAE